MHVQNSTLRKFIRESIDQESGSIDEQSVWPLIGLLMSGTPDICDPDMTTKEILAIIIVAFFLGSATVMTGAVIAELAPLALAAIDGVVSSLAPVTAALGGRQALIAAGSRALPAAFYLHAADHAFHKIAAVENAPISRDEKVQKIMAYYGEFALNILILVIIGRFSPTLEFNKGVIEETSAIVQQGVRNIPRAETASDVMRWAAKDAGVTYAAWEINRQKDNVMEAIKKYAVSQGYGDKVLRDLENLEIKNQSRDATRAELLKILTVLIELQKSKDPASLGETIAGVNPGQLTEQEVLCAIRELMKRARNMNISNVKSRETAGAAV